MSGSKPGLGGEKGIRFMTNEIFHTAIDVGTAKICTLIARLRSDSTPEIVGIGVTPSTGVRKGLVVNIEEARVSIRDSVAEATRSAGAGTPSAFVGVNGNNLEVSTRWGSVRSPDSHAAVSSEVLKQAIDAAYPSDLPIDKQLIHLIPQGYAVDGLRGVRNPVGMHATQIDVETLCVTGSTSPVQNLVRSVESNRFRVNGLVMTAMASGEAVLGSDEKETGIVVVDIGAGATTVAVFQRGILWNGAVLPVGGVQFSNDLAVALNTSLDVAEGVKLRHGQAIPEDVGEDLIELEAFGDRRTVRVGQREISQYLHDRAEELFRLIHMKVIGFGFPEIPPAGIVLTGGAAQLPGIDKVARQISSCPVRIGVPRGIQGLPDGLQGPAYAGSCGILSWGTRNLGERDVWQRYGGMGLSLLSQGQAGGGPLSWLKDKVKRVAL